MMNTITKELFKHARTLDTEIKVKQKAFDEINEAIFKLTGNTVTEWVALNMEQLKEAQFQRSTYKRNAPTGTDLSKMTIVTNQFDNIDQYFEKEITIYGNQT